MLIIVSILIALHLLWQIFKSRKKPRGEYYSVNISNHDSLEKNIKTAVYSDSE